jgi:hypothetical protein
VPNTVGGVEEPSWNVTVPVGVPEDAGSSGATVADNAIESPAVAGLPEEANVVLVAASGVGCTLTITGAETLAAKLLLPP